MSDTKNIYYMQELGNDSEIDLDIYITTLNCNEDRTWRAMEMLGSCALHHCQIIILDFQNQNELMEMNKRIQECLLPDENFHFVPQEKTHRDILPKTIADIINNQSDPESLCVGIDITSIPTPHFFFVLKMLNEYGIKPYLYYTEPAEYLLKGTLFNSYQSFEGTISTGEVPGFPGVTSTHGEQQRVLICVLGFDRNVLPSVIDAIAPDKIVAVNGFPSYQPKFKDISIMNNNRIFDGVYSKKLEEGESEERTDSWLYYVDAENPYDAYSLMEKLQQHFNQQNYNIDVVPLGTKPVALGICEYALKHDNIRILFPFPKNNKTISQNARKTWVYRFS